jgi:D-3-phosphoglycerate dehydrogenase
MQAFKISNSPSQSMENKVVITDHIYEDTAIEIDIIETAGAELVSLNATSASEIIRGAIGANVLLTTDAPITADVIHALPQLKAIIRMGAGYDNVDVEAATSHGVFVANVPGYGNKEVASHALALLLCCDRGLFKLDRHVRDGNWNWKYRNEQKRLMDKTLGIVGFGQIGKKLAALSAGLGVDIIVSDPYVSAEDIEAQSAVKVSFEELIQRSDLISIHTVLNEETHHLFNAEVFANMKNTAVLVNVARGGIIDQSALLKALNDDQIAVAGLDVTDPEPPAETDPIRTHDDIILTPHIAWYSDASLEELRRIPAEEAVRVLENQPPENIVNTELIF